MAMHFICHSRHLDSSMSTFVVVSILILSIPFHIIELEFQIIPDHFTQPVCPLDCLWITHSNISHFGRNLHIYTEQWNVDGGGRGNMSLANSGVDINIWVKAVLCALPISGLAFIEGKFFVGNHCL